MSPLAFTATLLAAFATTALGCRVLLHPRLGPRILDQPGARSLHELPTPRTGGLAIFAGVALALGGAAAGGLPLWGPSASLGAVLLLMALSLADDLRGLSAAVRFPVHAFAAGLVVWGGLGLEQLALPGGAVLPLGWAGAPLTVVYLVWMTNLYNFMDGMDGFAGGMGAWGFAALAALALAAGAPGFALTAGVLAAANGGFLTANFPPARLFMGDIGSVPMGFLAGTLSLGGARVGLFPLWVAVLVFSPFVVDATVTLLRRAVQGQRVWEAHRSHYYQRLVLAGWSHRRTTLAGYAIMAACALAAWLAVRHPTPAVEWAIALAACLLYLGIALAVQRRERGSPKP